MSADLFDTTIRIMALALAYMVGTWNGRRTTTNFMADELSYLRTAVMPIIESTCETILTSTDPMRNRRAIVAMQTMAKMSMDAIDKCGPSRKVQTYGAENGEGTGKEKGIEENTEQKA